MSRCTTGGERSGRDRNRCTVPLLADRRERSSGSASPLGRVGDSADATGTDSGCTAWALLGRPCRTGLGGLSQQPCQHGQPTQAEQLAAGQPRPSCWRARLAVMARRGTWLVWATGHGSRVPPTCGTAGATSRGVTITPSYFGIGAPHGLYYSGRSSSLPLASSPPGCRDGARRGAEELVATGPR